MKKNPLLKKSREYTKKLIKFIAFCCVVFITTLLLILNSLKVVNIESTILNLMCTAMGLFIPLFGSMLRELQDTTPWETYLTFIVKRDKLTSSTPIRISFAAFLIVEVDGLYLLVKNSHGIELYQPPARTYPIKTEEEMLELEKNFDLKDNGFIKKDYNDYRFKIPLKQIKMFYKRFCEKVDPTTETYQEIINDMVEMCGINKEIFSNVTVVFKDREVKKIEYKSYTDSYEMNVQDICKVILTEKQKKELRRVMAIKSDKYKFATESIIKSNGIDVANNKLYADIMVDTYNMLKVLSDKEAGKC